jgi:hypothetical protein
MPRSPRSAVIYSSVTTWSSAMPPIDKRALIQPRSQRLPRPPLDVAAGLLLDYFFLQKASVGWSAQSTRFISLFSADSSFTALMRT